MLEKAKDQGVDTFGRECRDLAKSIRSRQNSRSDVDELEQQRNQSKIARWVDRQTGMHMTLVECDPVTDRVIWAGIQRERAKLVAQVQRQHQELLLRRRAERWKETRSAPSASATLTTTRRIAASSPSLTFSNV